MPRKKKQPDNPQTNNLPAVVNSGSMVNSDDLGLFDKASLELQRKRHEKIGDLFDKASEVISQYLEDPGTEISAKMFPAKLAADIYMTSEKFRREDQRIEIEKRKLTLEERKSGQVQPQIGAQQNNFYLGGAPENRLNLSLEEIKRKQEEILDGFLPANKKGGNGDS